eukprot:14401066-Alexandrium_andersonii.AAC.1
MATRSLRSRWSSCPARALVGPEAGERRNETVGQAWLKHCLLEVRMSQHLWGPVLRGALVDPRDNVGPGEAIELPPQLLRALKNGVLLLRAVVDDDLGLVSLQGLLHVRAAFEDEALLREGLLDAAGSDAAEPDVAEEHR